MPLVERGTTAPSDPGGAVAVSSSLPGMSARRASTLAVASVVATALLVVVLAAWASSIGPSGVLRGDGPSPVGTPTEAPSSVESTATAPPGGEDGERGGTPSWVRALAFLVDLAVAIGLLYLGLRFVVVPLLRAGLRLPQVRRRLRRGGSTEEVEFEVMAPPEAIAREILADAEAQRRVLVEGDDPRNAVVECWHRFETHGAAAGLERRPWETSSEYTMRVLDLVDAYQPAVSRLGELYREARFSEHDLTEAHRQEALGALDAIHRTIGVRA